jgi:hypothetical protein
MVKRNNIATKYLEMHFTLIGTYFGITTVLNFSLAFYSLSLIYPLSIAPLNSADSLSV